MKHVPLNVIVFLCTSDYRVIKCLKEKGEIRETLSSSASATTPNPMPFKANHPQTPLKTVVSPTKIHALISTGNTKWRRKGNARRSGLDLQVLPTVPNCNPEPPAGHRLRENSSQFSPNRPRTKKRLQHPASHFSNPIFARASPHLPSNALSPSGSSPRKTRNFLLTKAHLRAG
jgi:hypothetical protein